MVGLFIELIVESNFPYIFYHFRNLLPMIKKVIGIELKAINCSLK